MQAGVAGTLTLMAVAVAQLQLLLTFMMALGAVLVQEHLIRTLAFQVVLL